MISSSTAAEVARGVSRLLIQEGYSPILEFTLPNGRRLDVAALGPGGEMLGVEIKVALADLRGDGKWPEYLDYCDLFYFAIPPDFPPEHVPAQTGLDCGGPLWRRDCQTCRSSIAACQPPQGGDAEFRQRCAAERLSAILESVAQGSPNLVVPHGLDGAEAEKIALSIPGAMPGAHYGQPSVLLREKFLTRVHHKEDAVVILTGSLEMRDVMLEAEPQLFYITDHYKNYPALLARLAKLDKKNLLALLQPRIAQIETAPQKARQESRREKANQEKEKGLAMSLTRAQAWKLSLSLPGAEERLWFNRPSVFIHDRFLTKVHEKEDAVVLYIGSMEMRDMMLEAEPGLFYIIDHYRSFPYLLARLSALTGPRV